MDTDGDVMMIDSIHNTNNNDVDGMGIIKALADLHVASSLQDSITPVDSLFLHHDQR